MRDYCNSANTPNYNFLILYTQVDNTKEPIEKGKR